MKRFIGWTLGIYFITSIFALSVSKEDENFRRLSKEANSLNLPPGITIAVGTNLDASEGPPVDYLYNSGLVYTLQDTPWELVVDENGDMSIMVDIQSNTGNGILSYVTRIPFDPPTMYKFGLQDQSIDFSKLTSIKFSRDQTNPVMIGMGNNPVELLNIDVAFQDNFIRAGVEILDPNTGTKFHLTHRIRIENDILTGILDYPYIGVYNQNSGSYTMQKDELGNIIVTQTNINGEARVIDDYFESNPFDIAIANSLFEIVKFDNLDELKNELLELPNR